MAKNDLTDVRNNDLSRGIAPYDFGEPSESEAHSDHPLPGIGGQANDSQATPQATRAGYGYQYLGPSDHALSQPKPNGHENNKFANKSTASQRAAMGGHNIDERNQYTVRMPRGSSL